MHISFDSETCILWNYKIEISIQNEIKWYKIHFMYFTLLAWKLPSEVETYCEIKNKTLTFCLEGNLPPSLILVIFLFFLWSRNYYYWDKTNILKTRNVSFWPVNPCCDYYEADRKLKIKTYIPEVKLREKDLKEISKTWVQWQVFV